MKRTKTGKRCKAHSLAGSDFCFFHDSESAEVRQLGRRMGGFGRQSSRTETPFPACDIATNEGLVEFMKALMNDTWKLGRSVGRARALCHIADLLRDLVSAQHSTEQEADEQWKQLMIQQRDIRRSSESLKEIHDIEDQILRSIDLERSSLSSSSSGHT